jgi:ABC-type Fe3+-hydroxamate transport system substrate-binding protein
MKQPLLKLAALLLSLSLLLSACSGTSSASSDAGSSAPENVSSTVSSEAASESASETKPATHILVDAEAGRLSCPTLSPGLWFPTHTTLNSSRAWVRSIAWWAWPTPSMPTATVTACLRRPGHQFRISETNYEKIVELNPEVFILPNNAGYEEAIEKLTPFGIKVFVVNCYFTQDFEMNCKMMVISSGNRKSAGDVRLLHGQARLHQQAAGRGREKTPVLLITVIPAPPPYLGITFSTWWNMPCGQSL